MRHNRVRDALTAAFDRAGWVTRHETTIDTRDEMQDRINNGTLPAGTEPKATIADAQLAAPGRQIVVDVRVVGRSPIQKSANNDEGTKRIKYSEVMAAHPNLTFQPYVITVYGTYGKETEAFMNSSTKTWTAASKKTLNTDLSLILAHYNGVMSMMSLSKGARKDQFPSFNKHFRRTA